jgi:hypothetical protein
MVGNIIGYHGNTLVGIGKIQQASVSPKKIAKVTRLYLFYFGIGFYFLSFLGLLYDMG